MRKGLFAFLSAFVFLLTITGVSDASYTFRMGSGSTVDTSGTNDVLKMEATVNSDLGTIVHPLEDGQSYSFDFATFYTNETWINDDDIQPGTIVANVDFDNPDLIQAIGGTSVGFSGLFHFTQGWNLTWNDPVVVDFGNGGQFTINLSDVSYESWFWQGPDGSGCDPGYADVYGTVTLNSSPVPIPSPLLLLGSGLIALIGIGYSRNSNRS